MKMNNVPGSIARIGGVLVAPWLYAAGRLARSPFLLAQASRVDPLYVRSIRDRLQMEGRETFILAQLINAIDMIAATGIGADAIVKQAFSNCQSQLGQDIACLLVHCVKRGGYFVEVGVGDGVNISNTYLLESQYDWSGLLVEPNQGFHDHIRSSRKAKLDTRCAALSDGKKVEFEEVLEAGEFSRLVRHGNREFDEGATRRYLVETATLDNLLEEHNAPREIDYISIDTEGTELEILQGLDFERYKVGFLTIEHNGNLVELKRLLEPKGYHQILQKISRWDAWFIHSSVKTPFITEQCS